MIERTMAKTARNLWFKYPVVTITGPRQSGKTTLAKAVFPDAEYVNLEIPDVREEALRDARGFMTRHKSPVIFDEIQNAPNIVSYIQAEVDDAERNSMYVLTGSHQPALQAAVSQSLAWRTGILELLPLSIEELKGANIGRSRDRLMFDGFMPRLYNKGPEPAQLYADYFRTYVERDVRQIANLRNLISKARVLDESKIDVTKVLIYSIVTVKNVKTNAVMTYTIVPESESDFKAGKISVTSPLAKALIGNSKGDTVTMQAPAGAMDFEILEVSR